MRILIAVVALAAALLAPSRSTWAFDATGHWIGKWSCKGFSAPFEPVGHPGKLVNAFNSGNGTSTLDITQAGTFSAIIDDFIGCAGGANQDAACTNDTECPGSVCTQLGITYNAVAVPAVKDPDNNGNILFLGCHLANVLPGTADMELAQLSIKTKANDVKATIKGTSIFADNFPESGICKYTYKRVSLADQAGAAPCL